MSETGYVIAFVVLALFVVAILIAFVMASMGWFTHRSGNDAHEFPNEPNPRLEHEDRKPAKQYWPHTSGRREGGGHRRSRIAH